MNITRVHGGLLNRMWRFDTDDGSFAVKQLNHDRGWTYDVEGGFRFERAAFAAGIPMPEPIAANETVLVHRWVDGDTVPEAPVSVAFARDVGAILARVHALDVEWSHPDAEDPMPEPAVWASLAERAAGEPWGPALAEAVPAFVDICRFVDSVGRPEPKVVSHKDVGQKNLLSVDGRPVVIDWECTGVIPIAFELGSTATGLACGGDVDRLQPEVFRAVLDGYADGGGTLPEPGAHWFTEQLGGWTWFTRWNIERCVAGVEPTSGPSLAVARETAGNGVRGLPKLWARLPQLAELTAR